MGNFPAHCNVAQPGAVLLRAEEKDKNGELGVVKNKPVTAESRTGCLQPSLHIGHISAKLRFQSTHAYTQICSATAVCKPVCQQIISFQPEYVPWARTSCSWLASTSQEPCPAARHRRSP